MMHKAKLEINQHTYIYIYVVLQQLNTKKKLRIHIHNLVSTPKAGPICCYPYSIGMDVGGNLFIYNKTHACMQSTKYF